MQKLNLGAMLNTAIHRFSNHSSPRVHLLKQSRCFCSPTSIHYPPLQHHPQWSGLHDWRRSPLNRDRYWGPSGPIQGETDEVELSSPSPPVLSSCSSLAEMGGVVLSSEDPLKKAELTHLVYKKWRHEGLPVGVCDAPSRPARPPKPQLVFCSILLVNPNLLLLYRSYYPFSNKNINFFRENLFCPIPHWGIRD